MSLRQIWRVGVFGAVVFCGCSKVLSVIRCSEAEWSGEEFCCCCGGSGLFRFFLVGVLGEFHFEIETFDLRAAVWGLRTFGGYSLQAVRERRGWILS